MYLQLTIFSNYFLTFLTTQHRAPLHCVSSCVFSDCIIHWNPASNTDNRKASLHCVFSCETSDSLIQWNFSHIPDKHKYFWAGLTDLNIVLLTLVTSIILHDSTVNPNVYLQFTISVNVLLHYWLISIGLHSTVCLPVFFQTTWFSETLLPILTQEECSTALCVFMWDFRLPASVKL